MTNWVISYSPNVEKFFMLNLYSGEHEICYAHKSYEPVHEISNNVVCVTSKASDQPVHMPSLIRAFARGLSIL